MRRNPISGSSALLILHRLQSIDGGARTAWVSVAADVQRLVFPSA
jgi:hypothetical protein